MKGIVQLSRMIMNNQLIPYRTFHLKGISDAQSTDLIEVFDKNSCLNICDNVSRSITNEDTDFLFRQTTSICYN